MTSEVLKQDLSLKPNKKSTEYLLKSTDYKKNVKFVCRMLLKTRTLEPRRNKIVPMKLIFYLSNKQNLFPESILILGTVFRLDWELNDKKFIDFYEISGTHYFSNMVNRQKYIKNDE